MLQMLQAVRAAQTPKLPQFDDIPEENRKHLSGLGYDVAVKIDNGTYCLVFSGVCNQNAYKDYPITEEEIESTNFEVVRSSSGQPFEKRPLIGKSCAIKRIDLMETRLGHEDPFSLKEAALRYPRRGVPFLGPNARGE